MATTKYVVPSEELQDVVHSEELHPSTNLVRQEISQECGGSDCQYTINMEEVEKEKERWFKSVMDIEINQKSQTSGPEISKVPMILRSSNDFKQYFQPRRISVGPYHHGTPKLGRAEMLKRRWAKQFIKGSREGIEALYEKILKEISELKGCYKASYGSYDDAELAWMMLVDGCSVLCFIHYTMDGKFRELNIDYRSADDIMQDIFLLENQLPFRVLELLLESRKTPEDVSMKTIETLISLMTEVKSPAGTLTQTTKEEQPFHLLDLLRTRLLGKPRTAKTKYDEDFLYRNVKVLMAARIRFRPSNTSELRDVSFTSYCVIGYLHLPPLAIDRSMVPLLWNLIAFEMCPNMTPDSGVTSYLSFLDALIDYSEDVKELVSAGVLQNSFGSNEEVAQFFNSISTNLPVQDCGFYHDVLADIGAHVQRHNTNKMCKWISELLDTNCSSPWKFIALVAAILVLFLTGTQTYFTVFPR